MKIPIFEELTIRDFSSENLGRIISESRIGRVPLFINLTQVPKTELENAIINLESAILEGKIHPKFPYPTYLITERPVQTIIPNVRSLKELPDHYFKKVKRPNNKELQLLNKLSLKVDKINNLNLYHSMNDLEEAESLQKRLYLETKELHFLELLNAKFFPTKK